MTNKFKNYYLFIQEDAKNFLDNYFEEFLQEIKDGDTNAYEMIDNDGKLHEHADQYIDLREAVEILEQSNDIETDIGLWEDLDPIQAVEAMAFWTYKNDLSGEVREQFKDKLEESKNELEGNKDELREKLDTLQSEHDSIITELDGELESFEEDDEDAQSLIDNLEDKINDLCDKISEVEDDISNIDNEIGLIEYAINDL